MITKCMFMFHKDLLREQTHSKGPYLCGSLLVRPLLNEKPHYIQTTTKGSLMKRSPTILHDEIKTHKFRLSSLSLVGGHNTWKIIASVTIPMSGGDI